MARIQWYVLTCACICAFTTATRIQKTSREVLAASTADLDKFGNCAGDTQKWLFILSVGRSGSTSILEMVNAIPGFFLGGENDGMMSDILRLKLHRFITLRHQGVQAWKQGAPSHDNWACALRQYTRSIIGDPGFSPVTTGFKEIRHTRAAELDLFLEVFPQARFIINLRKNTAAGYASMKSGHKGFFLNSENGEPGLREASRSLYEWGKKNADKAFFMALEDFSVQRFNDMLDWLDVPWCRYSRVVHKNKGGISRNGMEDSSSFIRCQDNVQSNTPASDESTYPRI